MKNETKKRVICANPSMILWDPAEDEPATTNLQLPETSNINTTPMETKSSKSKVLVRTLKAVAYIFLVFVFFLTWGLRQDPLMRNIPWILHIGAFLLLFWLVMKVKVPGVPEGEAGIKEEKDFLIKVALAVFCLLILIPILAVSFL